MRLWTAIAALALAVGLSVGTPAVAPAATDPAGCTPTIQYDPSIPTFKQVADANVGGPNQFSTNNGQSTDVLGGFQTGNNNRHPTRDLQIYQQAIADATAGNPRVRVQIFNHGTTFGGRPIRHAAVGTPANLAGIEDAAAFWRGVRDGSIAKADALARLDSGDPPPAFAWVTETPHGNEPAGGESAMRLLYELAARTDCANQRRLADMIVWVDPSRNPDGRDNNTRTSAFAFDHNRDVAFQTQDTNIDSLNNANKYPGLFFIDAHQQTSGYFFPPNEDPVLHEIPRFSLKLIQDVIGPALQQRFNDQSLQYRNYNAYDLFSNEYGDSGPSLFMGAAGMTFEKGTTDAYGKQVYDHYLAMDETLNVVAANKEQLTREWVEQWEEAAVQGAACKLQENVLVSPLHTPPSGEITQQPNIDICGYYIKAGQHAGDAARIVELLRGRDVRVFTLDAPVAVSNSKDFGELSTKSQTLPAGTLYIPAGQTMKHWLHSTLEEDPFIPYPYFYDVVNWSFPELFYIGGGGYLSTPIPPSAALTPLTGPTQLGGTVGPTGGPVLAFPTDSSKALGLVTQLLDGGATIHRSRDAFDAAGKHFPTGTALVDGSTIGSMDINAMARAMQTPVTSLAGYPAGPRYQLRKPKIALYTGATTEPQNPVFPGAVVPPGNGVHCPANQVAYCEMVFAFARELNVPLSALDPITSTELAAGALVTGNYTALVNTSSTIGAGAGATALQTFVNQGGNFVGYNAGSLTSLRNAGITTVNTTSTTGPTWNAHCPDNNDPVAAGSLTTPGTAFNANYNVTSPAAWGFDEGGYIYRQSSNDMVVDPATIGSATVAASYPTNLKAFGYQCNAVGPGQLPGRAYVIDQAFGAGHAVVIGSNTFFRGWTAGPQRLVMNAVLYPDLTAPYYRLPSRPGQRVAGTPLTRKQLRKHHKIKSRPARKSPNPLADATVLVKARKGNALRKSVRAAKLPAAVQRRVSYSTVGGYVRLRIKGAAHFARNWRGDQRLTQVWTKGDVEMRPSWAWRVIRQMTRRGIRPVTSQI